MEDPPLGELVALLTLAGEWRLPTTTSQVHVCEMEHDCLACYEESWRGSALPVNPVNALTLSDQYVSERRRATPGGCKRGSRRSTRTWCR